MDKLLAMLVEAQHQEIADRESRLLLVLAQEYTGLYGRLSSMLDELVQVMEHARAQGERVGLGWLYGHNRLRNVLDAVALELREYNGFAQTRLTEEQRGLVRLAEYHAHRLIAVSAGTPPPGTRLPLFSLPKGAIEQFAGRVAHDSSPLRKTLSKLPVQAQGEIRRSITTAIATGENPRKVAGQLRKKLGGPLYDYLRIARTEMLGAYRAASLEVYSRNEQVLKPEWRWFTPGGERTCAFCRSRHNRIFPISEPFRTHPQCRCTPLPVTRSWAEILNISERELETAVA